MNTESINSTIISKKLMLGDYVNINDGFYPLVAKVSGVGGWTTVNNETVPAIEYVFPSSLIRVVCAITKVSPISVNADILEKNGFKRVPQSDCTNPYHWLLEKYEEESDGLLYRITAYRTPFRGMYVIIDNHADCETINFRKQIEHFHELQHAFRLCSIPVLIRP